MNDYVLQRHTIKCSPPRLAHKKNEKKTKNKTQAITKKKRSDFGKCESLGWKALFG